MGILDFLFPKRCVGCKKFGDYICPDCFAQISFDVETICLICNRLAVDGVTHPYCENKYTIDGSLASIAYKGIAKRLVYAFKYQPYLSDLEKVLTDLFYEGLIQSEQFHRILRKESVLVPIPLHSVKYRERGYNQAEILAKNIGKRLGLPVVPLVKRVKRTQTQTTLKREERRENIKDAFIIDTEYYSSSERVARASREVKVNSSRQARTVKDIAQVILVDDVITSGATMREAANILKRNGVEKVWGIALAHGK